jgi:hypothetical protein
MKMCDPNIHKSFFFSFRSGQIYSQNLTRLDPVGALYPYYTGSLQYNCIFYMKSNDSIIIINVKHHSSCQHTERIKLLVKLHPTLKVLVYNDFLARHNQITIPHPPITPILLYLFNTRLT